MLCISSFLSPSHGRPCSWLVAMRACLGSGALMPQDFMATLLAWNDLRLSIEADGIANPFGMQLPTKDIIELIAKSRTVCFVSLWSGFDY